MSGHEFKREIQKRVSCKFQNPQKLTTNALEWVILTKSEIPNQKPKSKNDKSLLDLLKDEDNLQTIFTV